MTYANCESCGRSLPEGSLITPIEPKYKHVLTNAKGGTCTIEVAVNERAICQNCLDLKIYGTLEWFLHAIRERHGG